MTILTIEYTTAVCTPAGWRSETVTAKVETISEKRANIIEVIDIGGNGNSGYGSRTGAQRQAYNVGAVAARELGNIKILSKCKIIKGV